MKTEGPYDDAVRSVGQRVEHLLVAKLLPWEIEALRGRGPVVVLIEVRADQVVVVRALR